MNTTSQESQTSETSNSSKSPTFDQRMALLMSLREASLAHLRVLSDKCAVLLTNAGSGPKQSDWSAKYDHASACLKTRQASLLSIEDASGMESCQDFARSGMIVGGMYFHLPRLVQDISENVSCSSLPTPKANQNQALTMDTPTESSGTSFDCPSLHTAIRKIMLPTPVSADGKRGPDYAKDTPGMARTATDGRNRDDQLPRRIYQNLLPTTTAKPDQSSREAREAKGQKVSSTTQHAIESQIYGAASTPTTGGMRLTPEFLSWLMGFPPDWLKPLRAVPATQLSRKSSNPSPKQSNQP